MVTTKASIRDQFDLANPRLILIPPIHHLSFAVGGACRSCWWLVVDVVVDVVVEGGCGCL